MAITKRDQAILNAFPNTQIALQRIGDNPAVSGIPLGDQIAEGTSTGSEIASYSFAAQGGAIGTKVLSSRAIPAGAIITHVITEVVTAVTPNTTLTASFSLTNATGGSPSVLQSYAVAGLSTVGLTQTMLAAPVKATSAVNSLSLSIAAAPATAGVVNFYVLYVNPVQAAK